jgi:hypothetical protein
MTMSNCNHPIVLAFYLNREMLVNTELTSEYVKSVNDLIATKEYNVMAFFMPTDGEDRLECLNPIVMTDELKAEVYPIIEDIKKSFDIEEKKG